MSISAQEKTILQNEIAKKILDLDKTGGQIKALSSGYEPSEDMSLLYQKINEVLGNTYGQIGKNETDPLVYNHDFGGGVLNFSGFTWQKPMGNFSIGVNREIAPDLFSDRYIVHDTFFISISASTLLTSMKENELIDISDRALSAFVGIGFIRKYDYYHFANTYIEGITSDYSKLFLPFIRYNKNYVLEMPPYEIMKQSDNFTLSAGGALSLPIGAGFSLGAGALIQTSFKRDLTIQSLGPSDSPKPDEILRVSLDKSFKVDVDLKLELQVDFFNLLKLSILSYDLEYSFEDSSKYALSFYNQDKEIIKEVRGPASENPYEVEFSKIIKGRVKEPVVFKDHIVQLENRHNENLNSKFSFLLFGNLRKKQTEKVTIIKDEIETIFFKHYSESITFIQNFWSKLFNLAIFKIFKIDTGIKNAAERDKLLTIEYKLDKDLNEFEVKNEEDFSIILKQDFYAHKTDKWNHKIYLNESIKHLDKFSNLSADYQQMLRHKDLKGPLSITSTLRVEYDGIHYFSHVNPNVLFATLIKVCKLKKDFGKWLVPREREKMLKKSLVGANLCIKNLGKTYNDFKSHLTETGIYDLLKFKSFMTKFFKKTEDYRELRLIFGEGNVFMNGSFTATTREGNSFQTYFKEGDFKGFGVIDDFTRQDSTTVVSTK